jgi:deoxyadenosine/deoxycytidine kinase
MAPPLLVTVEGNIGVGKTTFLKKLEEEHGAKVIYEPVDEWLMYKDTDSGHSIFEMYYNNKKRYAFTFQIMALQTRFENLVKVCENATDEIIICERSIFTDFNIFAKLMNQQGDMSDVELEIYKKCHSFMTDLCGISIHTYIYLNASPTTCLQRVQKRNRVGEENIDIKFLGLLHDHHESWLNNIDQKNVVRVNTECDIDYNYVMEQINNLRYTHC